MKKTVIIMMSNMMAILLFASAALAAPQEQKKQDAKFEAKMELKADKKTVNSVTYDTYGTVTSVTYDTYGGHNGYKGLLNAFENVKDKPAGKVIAALLLKKYGIQTATSVTYDTYGKGHNHTAILTGFSSDLEASGEVELAVDMQKEAIKSDKKNLELYKKLGKLNAKLNKAGVKAFVNGEEPKFDVAPFIKEGRTLVPFRAISEALKADVVWNDVEKSVTVTKEGIVVKLVINSVTAYVNGVKVTLDVPAQIVGDRTVVPVRFISEALKAIVKFEAESQCVVIYDENE